MATLMPKVWSSREGVPTQPLYCFLLPNQHSLKQFKSILLVCTKETFYIEVKTFKINMNEAKQMIFRIEVIDND